MPISVKFKGLSEDDVTIAPRLDPSDVWFQYLCTTDDETGAHDPNGKPAPHVRPSHAAFHGTIWKINDPRAPVPPCDYGCRCGVRYVANPQAKAVRVMPVADAQPEVSAADPTRRWLKENIPNWREVAEAAGERFDFAAAVRACRRLGIPRPTEIARMVLAAMAKGKDPVSAIAQGDAA